MKTIAEIIDDTIPIALRTILAQSRMHLSEDTEGGSDYDLIALIGFSGAGGIVGTLGFAVEQSIVKAEYAENETALSDGWLGEIANQLLGRLKNVLLAYGMETTIQIPKVLHGFKLQGGPGSSTVKSYLYTSEYGRCCTWIDANLDLTQHLSMAEVEEEAQAEGEMVLF